MTEVFPWSPRVRSSGDTQPNVLSSQFGNGYSQRLPVGINNLAATWSVSFTGTEKYLKPIQDFFIRQSRDSVFDLEGRIVLEHAWCMDLK